MKFRYGAKALIRRRTDNKYLLLWSSKWDENPRRSQQPDLPGGIVEEGESITQGLLREVQEEVGFAISEESLKLVYAFVWNDADVSTLFQAYFAEIDDLPVTLSWEHERFEWLSADEVLALEVREPYPTIFHHMRTIGILN